MTKVSCSIPASASCATCSGRQIAVAGLRALRDRPQHVGVDALRTQDRNPDAVGLVRDREILGKSHRRVLGGRIGRASDLRQQSGGGNRVEEIAAAARLHARDQMPRGVDMRHDVNGPALRPWLVGSAAGILRHRIESAADAGVGAKQRNRTELFFSFLDDMADVLLLPHIAFEGRTIDRSGDGFRARQIEIGDHDFCGPGAVKGLAERAADTVGASGHNHDLACDLHRYTNDLKGFKPGPDRARRYNDRPRPTAQKNARSRSENASRCHA